MMRKTPFRHLPVRLPPFADELLSSWLCRHASFYAVPPLVMLRHCLPDMPSLRAANFDLSADQASRLASIFSIEPAALRRMTFAKVSRSSRRLIGAKTLQSCPHCYPVFSDCEPILRSQLLGWRITCPLCGELFSDPDGLEVASPFGNYREAALRGERLLDAEAERGAWTWASPVDIARLLLMRRIPKPFPSEEELWCFRVLGAIVPELDDLVTTEREKLPTSGTPILPLRLRPALLAGVAIVDRAGPGMLRMLQSHTMGDNRARFGEIADTSIAHARRPRAFSQWQLI
jgi:TniQ protein